VDQVVVAAQVLLAVQEHQVKDMLEVLAGRVLEHRVVVAEQVLLVVLGHLVSMELAVQEFLLQYLVLW
jgi:hypothetical protein